MRIIDPSGSGAPTRQSCRADAAPAGHGGEIVNLLTSAVSFVAVLAAAAAACCWIVPEPDLGSSKDFGPGETPIRAIFGAESWNDGRSVLLYCSDGRLTFFGAPERCSVELPATNVTAAVMSDDAPLLVTGHLDGEVRVWHVPGRKDSSAPFVEAAAFQAHRAAVRALAVTEDGRYAVSGDTDGLIVARNLTTGAAEWSTNEAGGVNDVAVSPAGNAIAFACDRCRVGLYRPATGVVRQIAGDADRGRSLRFSLCGRRLLIGRFDGGVTCWDVAADRLLWESGPVGADDPVRSLAVSSDGKTAAGSQREGITLWDMEHGHALRTFENCGGAALSLRFIEQDCRLQSFGTDGCARLWDLAVLSEPLIWELVDPTGIRPATKAPR